jgi:hypothetical protein
LNLGLPVRVLHDEVLQRGDAEDALQLVVGDVADRAVLLRAQLVAEPALKRRN